MGTEIIITSDEEQAVFDSLLASALSGVSSTLWDGNRPGGPNQSDVAHVAFSLAEDAFKLRQKLCRRD